MVHILRLLLWPISLIYALVITIRNYFYDWGVFKSNKFDLPVIVIGNLAVGGAGKSPLTEYLIRLLKNSYKVATLSRGYGRKTKGFLHVQESDSVDKVGDEPLQFKTKYPEITVAVCENRVLGVSKLQQDNQVVLLDDAFQHRALTPGFSILLITYESLFRPRLLLPAGDLRDTYNQRNRADIIIISKSPDRLSKEKRDNALKRLAASANQPVLFSYLGYDEPYLLTLKANTNNVLFQKKDAILLLTGIANPEPLASYIRERCDTVQLLSYTDHHKYTKSDIASIIKEFQNLQSHRKYILTTEKDAQRLKEHLENPLFADLPIWVIPVKAYFNPQEENQFSTLILNYCRENLK